MLKAAFGGGRALVLGVLGWGLPLLGTDGPQWRGPVLNRQTDATEAALNGLPADPRVAWRLKLGIGWAFPVVTGGRVFFMWPTDSVARVCCAA